MGVTGASVIISIVVSEIASEKSASTGETGASMKAVANASFDSSNIASAGVTGANDAWNELVSLTTEASSLPAKRTFIERVRTAAKRIVVAFIFSCCLCLMRQRYMRGVGWDRDVRLNGGNSR